VASPGAVAPPAVIPSGPFYNVAIRFADQSLVYSLGERFLHKWPAMVQQTMRSPIIGLGPSAATEAADGYYLRVFVESGILGVLVFVGLVFTVARSSLRAARRGTGLAKSLAVASLAATVFVALVGVLIDTWVASRVMELFWPLIGLSLAAVALQTERIEAPSAIVLSSAVSTP
jgi:O-antigen ligase